MKYVVYFLQFLMTLAIILLNRIMLDDVFRRVANMPTEGVILSGTLIKVELKKDRTLESSARTPKVQKQLVLLNLSGKRTEINELISG